jgi:ceramide glucosyltransferase
MNVLIWGATAVLALGLVLHLGTMGLVIWRARSRTSAQTHRPQSAPFICLMRPVCGLDPFDAETLASSFTIDYPNYEVIFCAADPADPVIKLVERLIASFPHVRARLLIGEDAITGNPKLNNLQKGWINTDAPWVAMADSNLVLPRSYLYDLIGTWNDGVGLVSSPPLGDRAEGVWAGVECAFLNTNQARWQLAADALGFGFAQGKTLFWRRKTLDDIGGLRALGRKLAEDVTATKVVREGGKRVCLVDTPYVQPIGRRSFRSVWDRQLRWARVRRDGFRWIFALELLNGPVLGLIAASFLGAQMGAAAPAALVFAVIWYGAEIGFAGLMGWRVSTAAGDGLTYLLRDAMMPLIWCLTWLRPGFVWRGTAMAPVTAPRFGAEQPLAAGARVLQSEASSA